MKILHTMAIGGIAGAEKYLINMLPALQDKNIDVSFLMLYKKEREATTHPFAKILEANNIKVYSLGCDKIPKLSFFRKIAKLVKSQQFDVIHSHLLYADFLMAIAKMLFFKKTRLVSTKHGYEEAYNSAFGFDPKHKKRNLYHFCACFAEKMMNRSFAISKGLQNLYKGLGICQSEKLEVIPYGFDFPKKQVSNKQETYRFAARQLVLVGRLTAFKGHKYAFEAIQLLKQKYPNLTLVVVGNGELEAKLKALAKSMNIEKNIVFTGYRKDAVAFMKHSDIVLVPSRAEGFGVVVLEAMSTEKPIICFDVPALNEVLEDRITGLLIPPYDIPKLAGAIEELLTNINFRDFLGKNAKQRLEQYYCEERMVNDTIQFYTKVVAHHV